MSQVLILGGVSFNTMVYLENFPQPQPQTIFPRKVYETVGSTGAGKALNLRKLGYQVLLHGFVGQDHYATAIKSFLTQHDVAFLLEHDPAGTQRHVNLMNAQGERISIFIEGGTFEPAFNHAQLEGLIIQAEHIVLGITNYCRFLIPIIQRYNKAIWCDIHDYDGKNPYYHDFINAADYLSLSSEHVADYRQLMQDMIARGKKLVVCTHGKRGATCLTADGQWFEQPSLDYELRDSNGAGDAFFAGFFYGLNHAHPIQQALRFATISAGLCITSPELFATELSEPLLLAEYERVYRE